jgi:hypothetical protein
MKKLLFLVALVSVSLANTASAQIATLNITLGDVLSFSVTQPAALNVNFDSEAKYTNGITTVATDHITVTSSQGYVVKVIAGTVSGTATLNPNSVKITSSIGSTNAGNTSGITYGSGVTLPASGSTAATVITATNGSWSGSNASNKFNISYLIGANGAYAGKTTGSNVIPVTYTVIQP